MLEDIKTPEKAASFLESAIQNKSKIMGFGHRESVSYTHLTLPTTPYV